MTISKPKRILVAVTALLLMASPHVPFTNSGKAFAAPDTFTLTKSANNKISVALNGTPQVQLPNGIVTTANTVFTVTENRTFTFVGIDGARKFEKSVVMDSVPNTAPLLMASPGEPVFLNFESGDTHSGVTHMRYVAYDEAKGQGATAYSTWETYKTKKAWTIPTIPANTSATWIVKAEFRDKVGNIASNVVGRFFIDNVAPTVTLEKTPTYTNLRDIEIVAGVTTQFEDPENGLLSTALTGPYKSYTLMDLTNEYTGGTIGNDRHFEYNLPYTLPATDGIYDLYFKATKRQHTRVLTSAPANKKVIYDKTPPTGTVIINDGDTVAPSNEVKLTIRTDDNLSGVDRIKIVEESDSGSVKEITINNPDPTEVVDWTLYVGDTAKVTVVVTDKAGNNRTIASQEVVFSQMAITKFELLNNRNPVVYNETNPFQVRTWDWDGDTEPMLAGSSFDFSIYYDLGMGQPVDYNITGTYDVIVKTDDGTYNKTSTGNAFVSPLSGGFKAENVPIPLDAPENAKVLVSATLNSERKTNSSVKSQAEFLPAHIGTVGNQTLEEAVNSRLEFQEIN